MFFTNSYRVQNIYSLNKLLILFTTLRFFNNSGFTTCSPPSTQNENVNMHRVMRPLMFDARGKFMQQIPRRSAIVYFKYVSAETGENCVKAAAAPTPLPTYYFPPELWLNGSFNIARAAFNFFAISWGKSGKWRNWGNS